MEKQYLIEPLRERCYYICNDELIYYFDSRLLVIDPSKMNLDDKGDCYSPVVYHITEGGTLIRQESFYYGNGNDTFEAFDFSNNKELRERVLKVAFFECVSDDCSGDMPVSYWSSKVCHELRRIGLQDALDFKDELELIIPDMVASDPTLKESVKL